MRRESSTVVVLAGAVSDQLLAELGSAPNVSVVRLPADEEERGGWEAGMLAMREAARRRSTYVLVTDDPLARVAAQWRAMWDVSAGAPRPGAAGFEQEAAQALAAWQGKRFELPDYYLVIASEDNSGPDFYLGPLRAVRPRRVAVGAVTAAGPGAQAASAADALRSLPHGPWWPPLEELIGAARGFYAGGLTETQRLARA